MPSPEMSAILLTDLEVGHSGELAKESDHETPQRLRELGFVAGTTVTMVRIGALGDPIEVELRGYRMCQRRRDLEGVHVVLKDVER
jgi:Fe2+ transport system protein FeoA